MLRIIEGGFYSSLHDELINEIRLSLGAARKVYLIVPEQQTVLAECELSGLLSPLDSLVFEVTNFTRFTNTAFRELGGISGEYSTGITKSLIMWKTLTELSPTLSLTEGRSDVSPGIVKKALSAVAEMQSFGISPDELGEILGGEITNKRLEDKLGDLYSIYKMFREELGRKYNDTSDDCGKLAELISINPDYLRGVEIYIDGFTSFTEPQYRLIRALVESGGVTVALSIDSVVRTSFEYREVYATRERLLRDADLSGVEKAVKKAARHKDGASELLAGVCELLWTTSGTIDNNCLQEFDIEPGRVRIFSAPTVYEECDFIAADIKKRLMEGDSPEDIAIVARDAKAYIGILDISLEKAGLPYFLSKTEDISSASLVKLISTAYAVIKGGYRAESIITYMKSGLIGVSSTERDELELYLEKWHIDGKRLGDMTPFNMNPRGYERFTKSDNEKLARINATRVAIINPLLDFGEEVEKAETVRAHAEVLLTFLTKNGIPALLSERAAALASLGEVALSEETLSLWGILCDALDVVVEVLGDVRCDAESFLNQLKVALSGAAIGRIPSYRDVITIGAADMLRINEKKHIYLIGVNADEFPASVSEDSYFTEQDKLTLRRLGLGIKPDLDIKCAREYYSFSRAFAKARSTVTLLYAEKTAMTKPINPAEVIGRIVDLCGGRVKKTRVSELEVLDRIYTPEAALETLHTSTESDRLAIRSALEKMGLSDRIALAEADLRNKEFSLGAEALALIYGGDLYLSETKVSAFTSCPMKYFLRYGVGISEEEEAEINSLVIGSFVHGVVEKVFEENKRRGVKLAEMTREDRDRLTEACAERYVEELFGGVDDSASTAVTISRLSRATKPVVEGLARELEGSQYEPRFFEIKLDAKRDDAPDPIVLEDESGRIVLGGIVDRIDTYKSGDNVYVKISDYKTGTIDFLPSKLQDGEYLQMFIYLRAVTETKAKEFRERLGVGPMGNAIPAGVIYIKTEMKDVTVRREAEEAEKMSDLYTRDGMLLADEESISAMNGDFIPKTPEKPSRYYQSRFYDSDGWQDISNTVESVVREIAAEIRSGEVRSTPGAKKTKSCNWCPYKEICRNAAIEKTFH